MNFAFIHLLSLLILASSQLAFAAESIIPYTSSSINFLPSGQWEDGADTDYQGVTGTYLSLAPGASFSFNFTGTGIAVFMDGTGIGVDIVLDNDQTYYPTPSTQLPKLDRGAQPSTAWTWEYFTGSGLENNEHTFTALDTRDPSGPVVTGTGLAFKLAVVTQPGPSDVPPPVPSPSRYPIWYAYKTKSKSRLPAILGSIIGGLAILGLVGFFFWRRSRNEIQGKPSSAIASPASPSTRPVTSAVTSQTQIHNPFVQPNNSSVVSQPNPVHSAQPQFFEAPGGPAFPTSQVDDATTVRPSGLMRSTSLAEPDAHNPLYPTVLRHFTLPAHHPPSWTASGASQPQPTINPDLPHPSYNAFSNVRRSTTTGGRFVPTPEQASPPHA